MKEFTFYWLDAERAKALRDEWRQAGAPLGNSYYWIQYKDGSVVVFDHSYNEDKIPSLNLNDVLFISDWFAAERGGYGECYINPRLSHEQIQDIITGELYDEDGNYYYDTVNSEKSFPLKQFEPFLEDEMFEL